LQNRPRGILLSRRTLFFRQRLLAATVVPLIAVNLPTSASADVIVMVGFFAFARFFLGISRTGYWYRIWRHGSSSGNDYFFVGGTAMLMAVFTLPWTVQPTNYRSPSVM